MQCHIVHPKSRWGTEGNSTIIVKGTPSSTMFSPEAINGYFYAGYSIPGFGLGDDVVILKNLTAGEKVNIHYGADWTDFWEANNEGIHCINVEISCLL